ncbi:DUF4150 domain-containing protein [Desulfoluna spongiiphila]|uniref:Uncharacterized protein n=1 Tax=Desulfoluna spongiiphila TaxID=419481 RepID=A0A1G5E1V4_9BACT|nr:DUF4150 domain-containing protein [Desulfoluna spongiiphila]SCY20857.1 protein of unknown function [Desulfoluna spongiiphila]
MGVTVGANGRTVVHKSSGGTSVASPDVCRTQIGPVVVPIPYANTAMSSDLDGGAQTVKADGNPLGHAKSNFKKSIGDEAGDKKGTASGTIQKQAEFTSSSFDVQVEGNGVVRAFDTMIHNNKNTPPAPLMQAPLVQEIMDETPVIPEQGKVEMRFVDPFGDPMEGFELEVEVDGKKEIKTAMAQGQIVHVSEKEKVTLSVMNNHIDFKIV